jgi:glycerophosphoryl diester phosphodiesterase
MMENVAFRGFSAVTPENTLTAFRRAAQAGCQRLRSDLRLSRDGEIFLFADPSLHRVTGTHGWLHRLSAEELLERPVHFRGRSLRRERLTRLAELMDFALDEGLGLQLEIHSGSSPRWKDLVAPTVDAVLRGLVPWSGRVDLQLVSGDARVLRELLARSPWPVGALLRRLSEGWTALRQDRLELLVAEREVFFAPYRRRSLEQMRQGARSLLEACRSSRRRFYAGPVSRLSEMEVLRQLDLDGVLSPNPAQFAALELGRDASRR